MTAETAWNAYKSLKIGEPKFDVSSYEYSITLLCQSLRVEDARQRILEMKLAFGVSEDQTVITSSDNQSSRLTEVLAMAYGALARAYTILNQEKEAISACEASLGFAERSKDSLKKGNSFSSESLSIHRHFSIKYEFEHSRKLLLCETNIPFFAL